MTASWIETDMAARKGRQMTAGDKWQLERERNGSWK